MTKKRRRRRREKKKKKETGQLRKRKNSARQKGKEKITPSYLVRRYPIANLPSSGARTDSRNDYFSGVVGVAW